MRKPGSFLFSFWLFFFVGRKKHVVMHAHTRTKAHTKAHRHISTIAHGVDGNHGNPFSISVEPNSDTFAEPATPQAPRHQTLEIPNDDCSIVFSRAEDVGSIFFSRKFLVLGVQ
jgi:hypothetical protein